MTNLMAGEGRMWLIRSAAVAALALLLAGCAADNRNFYVAPGKYQLYDCVQLKTAAAGYVSREVVLRQAMNKADTGPGGGVASFLGYGSEYGQIQGNLDQLRAETTAKKCTDVAPGLFGPAPVDPAAAPGKPKSRSKPVRR